MALVLKDRVKQTTTTTGTGSIVLNGTVDGFQTFAAALTDGDTTYYSIFEPSTNEWEVGLGTWTEGTTTLARTTVLASSNAGSAVSLTAQAEVFISQPAGKVAYFNASGDLDLTRDPQTSLQAATKQYVDTIAAAGLHYHDPVRVEQEGNLSATYDNGTAGVGATLTNNSTQAALVIDGVTLSTNDRVLIYEQTDATQNGVYTVTDTGSVSTNWVLTRATDADSYGASDPDALGQGDAFFVLEGAAGAGELYVMNTEGTITFGTTNITFTQVAATAVYDAGDGLTLTGTTFAVGAGTGVTVNANDIAIGQSVGTGDTVTFATVNAALTGNVTGNVTGDVTGNADTATALETARNIGGVSFDGTASINLPGVNTTGNQDTTGNAATATAWETGRTISLTGDVTGSVAGVDGTGNASIATTIAANSVALGTDTTGDYVSTITSGNYLTGGVTGEGSTPTLNVDATPNNTASKVVARDASGNFSAGTITAALSGNASTATALATGRTISLTGDVTGTSGSFDGSGNVSIATTIGANSVALGTDTTGNYVATITAGTGISGSSSTEGGTPTIALAAAGAGAGTYGSTADGTKIDTITLDAYGRVTAIATGATGDIQGVTAGTNLTGGGTSGTVTLNMATGGVGAGTYGSTSDGTKIDTITVDAYGRVTAVATGTTGDILGVTAGTNLNGGGTSGTVTLNIDSSPTFAGVVTAESVQEDYDALSGTSPAPDADNAGAFSLTTSGNTTFTFGSCTSGKSVGFILELTAGGTHTVTWPSSVEWAGGTAPDAPASGETDILVFWSRDGGTTWYGILSSDAAA